MSFYFCLYQLCFVFSLSNAYIYRYRPARGWMKTAEKYIEAASMKPDFAPGAGSLLIDKKVLARRYEDGQYYLGKVKSQVR